jgi:branched-chain amino acid transport system permease protein
MDTFVQQLINGITLGSVYAVVALGYTMVYGIIQLINFAHGEVVMIGGMVSYTVLTALVASNPALSPLLLLLIATLVAIPVCMGIGFTMERVAYKPLRKAPRLAPLITAIGISIILQHLVMVIFTRNNLSYPQVVPLVTYNVTNGPSPATITNVQIGIICASILMMLGLLFLVHRTKLGIAMRAVSQNQQVAGLMGVDINRVISYTFMIGAALGAVAGVMWGTYYGIIHYTSGFILGLKAFSAAVLGGIGNLAGAMLGGLLLGIIEALGAGYIGDLTGGWIGSNYQDVFAFLVLIAVLIFRPSGLLGERVGDRA